MNVDMDILFRNVDLDERNISFGPIVLALPETVTFDVHNAMMTSIIYQLAASTEEKWLEMDVDASDISDTIGS